MDGIYIFYVWPLWAQGALIWLGYIVVIVWSCNALTLVADLGFRALRRAKQRRADRRAKASDPTVLLMALLAEEGRSLLADEGRPHPLLKERRA